MAKRRANGEGNIRKRKDGRWEGRYTAGYDPATGKRITKNVLGKTQAEVKEKLQRAIELAGELDIVRSEEYTVGEWVQTKDPGLSSSYVRGVHTMLHNCLDRAVKERLIPRNPTDDCIIPKLQKREIKILPADSIRNYLRAADERGVLPMFFLELVSGMRKGELVALLWEDLDIPGKTISVSKQATVIDRQLQITRPKTETSIRKISIPQEAVDLLLLEHEKHSSNPYMFPSPRTGGMYHPDSVVNLHKKILRDAGLDHIPFHALRHTFATTALQTGIDVKTVSSMLGHYSAGFTLTTYAHATARMQEEAASRMGSYMAQNL